MDKKLNKKSFTTTQVGVLVEELRSEFRVFGDELSAVKAQGKNTNIQVGKLTEEITVIKTDIRFIKEDIKILKKDVSVLKEDVNGIKTTLEGQDKRLERLESVLS